MRVDIRGHGFPVSAALRAHIERRLHFALGRFGGRVRQAMVRVSDLNGPRGGVDKACRIAVRLPASPAVVVEDADGDLYVAIDRAADRIGRSVGRHLARDRSPDAGEPRLGRRTPP
jgi:ribosomal subunit interface protein